MALSKMDKTGRVYIPGELREAAGIGPDQLLEVNLDGDKLVVKKKKNSVARTGRGMFKLPKHIEDVDAEFLKGSKKMSARELREIRRR